MAWGSNSGGRGIQIQPRPALPEEHQLNPRFEAILRQSRSLEKRYRTYGEQLSNDNVVFPTDPERQPIPVPQAAMILQQSGIPLNHPQYPIVKKFNSRNEDWRHYFVFTQPIPWEKDEKFRYIPGYTRYVISEDGFVRNAFNGKLVEGTKYMYELVRDGGASPSANEPRRINKTTLIMLAWGKLPENFIDYGFGNYSHRLDYDKATNVVDFVPLQEVFIKEDGAVRKYSNMLEYIECEVPKREQEAIRELRGLTYNPIGEGIIRVGPLEIKAVEPYIPAVSDEEAGQASASTPVENGSLSGASQGNANNTPQNNDASSAEFDSESFDSDVGDKW